METRRFPVPTIFSNLIGKARVLISDLRIEDGNIGLAPVHCVHERSNVAVAVPGLQECPKIVDVLLRHRPRSISRSAKRSFSPHGGLMLRTAHMARSAG